MKVVKIFEAAIQKAPSVVVIDEMDSFLGQRQGSHDYRVEEANEFLRQIQNASNKRVLVIGMTNLIERIDPAFLRKGRFDHVIQVDLPSPQAVRAVLGKLLADKPCAEGFSLEAATLELTGRPLSDTSFIVREASRLAVRMGKDKIDDICLAQSLKLLTGKV